MPNEQYISIGIDGGGSGSRYSFRTDAGDIIRTTGPSLQGSAIPGEEIARRILEVTKNTLGEKIKYIRLIRAGIAGFASHERSISLKRLLENSLPEARLEIYSDISAAFGATFSAKTSGNALLICGTGSALAIGDSRSRKIRITGGSGPGTFEPGSGRQIGEDFIVYFHSFSFQHKERLLQHFDDSDILKQPEIIVKHPALLAPVCLDLAAKGDATAQAIILNHIKKTLELLYTAVQGKALVKKLALHGGLFNNTYFSNELISSIGKYHPEIHILNSPKNIADLISEPGFKAPAVHKSG